jgi:Ca2+-binding EF-hand superfamily protein
LLVKFDRNRDGKLTYNEAEELLREVGVFFNTDFWNNVLVNDLLDPGKRN